MWVIWLVESTVLMWKPKPLHSIKTNLCVNSMGVYCVHLLPVIMAVWKKSHCSKHFDTVTRWWQLNHIIVETTAESMGTKCSEARSVFQVQKETQQPLNSFAKRHVDVTPLTVLPAKQPICHHSVGRHSEKHFPLKQRSCSAHQKTGARDASRFTGDGEECHHGRFLYIALACQQTNCQ